MSLVSRQFRNCLILPKYLTGVRFQQTQVCTTVVGNENAPINPIFRNVNQFPERIALRDKIGVYTYANLFISAKELAEEITTKLDGKTGERILFLCPNDADYVITLWAIWMSGQIAVPLSPLHPQNILLYYANDTKAKLLIASPQYADLMHRVSKNTHSQLFVIDDKTKLKATEKNAKSPSDLEAGLPPQFYEKSKGLIIYTSGTTGNPKGAVLTHKNLVSQVNSLLDAWKWTQNDVILHTLPLHHTHGIINALLCPLYIGAKINMLPKFNANVVWSHLLGVNTKNNDRKVTVFMAVPTIYSKLIDEYGKVFTDPKMKEYIKNHLKNKVRLMVSGSAPLPVPVYHRWFEISGHNLLERYGMTEIGMCLSNSYDKKREPGCVGLPLPGVSVALGDKQEKNHNYNIHLECSNANGEIQFNPPNVESDVKGELLVKGDGIFLEYFNRPEATRKEFTPDGWFKTGDICQYSVEKSMFKILGRESVDIIKVGGYKVSALQIETLLLEHPDIKDCAVIGVADEKWGEKIGVLVVPKDGDKGMVLDDLREWCSDKMPKYQMPTVLKVVDNIPKNIMGKVNKKELAKSFAKNV